MDVRAIKISEFDYPLEESRIAKYPLEERDQSKLLIFKDGIQEDSFKNLATHIPKGTLIVRNNTKVVQARLLFYKESGAKIEIFLIEPVGVDPLTSMQSQQSVTWSCLIGNAKKWKEGPLSIQLANNTVLNANKIDSKGGEFEVEFSWSSGNTFAEILEIAGKTPLPPYLNRDAEDSDKERYQTIYSKFEGSVAAPTAGLHFTKKVEEELLERGCQFAELTLHVGAGTFKPVKAEEIGDHEMHSEHFTVSLPFLKQVLSAKKAGQLIVCVGTTSLRALESLFWFNSEGDINQWDPYSKDNEEAEVDVLSRLISYLEINSEDSLKAKTGIMIAPGYRFKFVDGIITNFHQPGSTLLLLVSALIGNDWKKVYDYALKNEFRFLSYGDSSLLWKKQLN